MLKSLCEHDKIFKNSKPLLYVPAPDIKYLYETLFTIICNLNNNLFLQLN